VAPVRIPNLIDVGRFPPPLIKLRQITQRDYLYLTTKHSGSGLGLTMLIRSKSLFPLTDLIEHLSQPSGEEHEPE
jgi:hypothetical protein